jgi:DNA polymerase III gamma/tau subunit
MATTERHRVPATILSRCQQFVFRMISSAEILDHLQRIAHQEGIRIDPAALAYIVKASEGSMRDAQSLLDQIISFSGQDVRDEDVREVLGFIPNEILDRTLDALASRDSRTLIESIGFVTDQGLNIQQYLREFLSRVRDMLLIRFGLEDRIIASPEEKRSIAARSEKFSEQDLIRFFDMLLRLESDLRYSQQPRFHVEVAFLKLARLGHVRDIEEVIRDMRTGTEMNTPAAARHVPATASASKPDPGMSAALPATSPPAGFGDNFRRRVEEKSPATAIHLEKAARIGQTETGIQIVIENRTAFSMLDSKEHRRVLDEVGRELVGQPISVSLIISEQQATTERPPVAANPGQTMESAREEPLVKRFLEVFRGDLAQIKPAKGE